MSYLVSVDTGLECVRAGYEYDAQRLLEYLVGVFESKEAVEDLTGVEQGRAHVEVSYNGTLQAEALVETGGKLDKAALSKHVRKGFPLAKVYKRELKGPVGDSHVE